MKQAFGSGVFLFALSIDFLSMISACHSGSVTNIQSDTVFCETLDSAKFAKETRGRLAPPNDCLILPKGSWYAVVLYQGDGFYHLAAPLAGGGIRKGWASTDQLYDYSPGERESPANWGQQFRSQVERCWKIPYGVTSKPPTATFTIRLRRDGTLEDKPTANEPPSTPYLGTFQESAIRAIVDCQPYKLPQASFDEWKLFSSSFTGP